MFNSTHMIKTSLTIEDVNEAEFQASIINRIRAAFPLLPLDIRAERYLNLKLGHHDITIDGRSTDRQSVKGRLDVIIFNDNKPLLLVELKAPNVKITNEDIDQGLSYARLHQPMVPLVLVTNGDSASTKLVLTYDGSSVPNDQYDLSKILQSAAALSAKTVDSAIHTLLGNDSEVWRDILSRWNLEAISSRTGKASDIRKAIVENFSIPREAVESINKHFSDGAHTVVLHGLPLSGVTSVLAQLLQTASTGPYLYIDSKNTDDVLLSISNRLSQELSTGISKDNFRQWLNTGQSLPGLTLLIDGLPKGSIDELLQLAEAKLLRVVFGLDSWVFSSLCSLPGRSEETTLSRLARQVELTELSDTEFTVAQELISELFNVVFLPGADAVPELRFPRALRMLISQAPTIVPKLPAESNKLLEAKIMLPAIPTFRMLGLVNFQFNNDPQLQNDLLRLANAFLVEITENGADPDRIVETFGIPSIDPNILESQLGETRVQRLLDLGIVHWTNTRLLGPRIVIRFPELVAHQISLIWEKKLGANCSDDEKINKLNDVLQLSTRITYGDLAVAAAIARIDNGESLKLIMFKLLELAPEEVSLNEGTVVEFLAKDHKGIRLHFPDGFDEKMLGNLQPWLVLSHLAAILSDHGDDGYSFNMTIFANLGNSKYLIYTPPEGKLNDAIGMHFHEVPGVGSLLCASAGIIEPLTQAMYFHAMQRPNEFEELVQYAIANQEVFFAWRLTIVTRILRSAVNPMVKDAGLRAYKILSEWWDNTMGTKMLH